VDTTNVRGNEKLGITESKLLRAEFWEVKLVR